MSECINYQNNIHKINSWALLWFLCLLSSVSFSQGAMLVAQNDDFSSNQVNGIIGGVAGNVFTNDTVDGAVATSTSVIPTLLTNDNLAGVTISLDGNINVPAGTPSRIFTLTYQICENGNITNCANATITVSVDADDDGDGILDSVDSCNGFDDNLDNDSDGIPDGCDEDDDNDNISDINEGCPPEINRTYKKIFFSDGTIDTSAPADVNLVYSTTTNYVSIIGGDTAPGNNLFLNGFDPIGGQAKMVFNLNTPYLLTIENVVIFKAYLFDNRRDFSGEYDLPIRMTINTDTAGAFTEDKTLTPEQTQQLDDGKWIEVVYEIPIPGSGRRDVSVNNITMEIEVNSDGVSPVFQESFSEVFGIVPIALISDLNGLPCTIDSDNDGIVDSFDDDDDGDGILTVDESTSDCNGDGIPDYLDTAVCIDIPNAFSPNGDGVNDTFFINQLQLFPNFKIEVFNRYGNKVYEYNNNGKFDPVWWDGFSTGRLTQNKSKPLPSGSYFYIIYYNDGVTSPINGLVYINR